LVELAVLVVLAALGGRIAILIGPRTWYSPSAPIAIFSGLVGGPLAGALVGAASEGLTTDRVWQHRLFGAARTSTEGFAAGLAGVFITGFAVGDTLLRTLLALTAAFVLAQLARALVIVVRGIRPAGRSLVIGSGVDLAEAMLAFPLLSVFVAAHEGAPALVVLAFAAIICGLALAERAHARQAELLEHERGLARTDPVTGAPNRLAFEEALAHEHARIVRGGRPAGLFLLDLDFFKQINDVHGHDVGDRVLGEAVDRLVRGLRGMDVVARWGGDELIVLAPDLEDVAALEEYGVRLRRLISRTPLDVGVDVGIDATASVGGTVIDGSTTPELALKRADVAVYRAKESRDTSVIEVPAETRALALVPAPVAIRSR
jgi:diguanylate cyclase (GGDEF)-like protein